MGRRIVRELVTAAKAATTTRSNTSAKINYVMANEIDCYNKYEQFQFPNTELYCNWTFDTILCWPPTKAGTSTSQNCPAIAGSDTSKYVYKRCSNDGRWEGLTPNDTSRPFGYTHYNTCWFPEIQDLLSKLDKGGSKETKMDIAWRTRILEMVGLSVSLAALIVSLIIFSRFRGLRNNRTRIHKNLFLAMMVQVIIRLTLYVDQMTPTNWKTTTGIRIENTPYLCEGCYVLLEYARTAMFMWMFVEGLYLHNVITVTIFQEYSYYVAYSFLGWGVPAIITASWTLTMIFIPSTSCWYSYNLMPYFWILEGPRLTVILLNFLFLLNIIRVLVMKLRQSHTSEIEQVRKAVRAALVLLPLLGIANILKMPGVQTLDKAVWEFALWSYTTHFITSFQGFFISTIYCFFNGEVRAAIMKSVSVYLSLRDHHNKQTPQQRRSSFVSAGGGYYEPTTIQPPLPVIDTIDEDDHINTLPALMQTNKICMPCCKQLPVNNKQPQTLTRTTAATNQFFGHETQV